MRTFDFAPLFRSSVGFDRLFDFLARPEHGEPSAALPAYDIEKASEDAYRITLAVAGFAPGEIEVTQNDTALLVAGRANDRDGGRRYLHRGIARRSFRLTYALAEHVQVTGAILENGLLTIDLRREVPDAGRPRRIAIDGATVAIGQDNAPSRTEGESRAA
jgi:molecular chaperone IbpA